MADSSIELPALIRRLESLIQARAGGLPEEVFLFVSRITPLVNVDLLIQDDCRRTLLTWRSDQFFGPGWHVPGGIIRHKETAADRIRMVAKRELGVTVDFDPEPMRVHQGIVTTRRDRSHSIALLYRCWLTSELNTSRQYRPEAPLPDQWSWHERCPVDLIPEQLPYAPYMG